MNNIKGYDEFVNEELNWKDVKRFGRRVKLEYSFAKAHALLGVLKALFFWSKPMRGVFRELDIFIARSKKLGLLYNMHDLTNKAMDKMSDEDLKTLVDHMAQEYAENNYADLAEDIKVVIENIMRNPDKLARNHKKQEGLARCRRFLRVLENEDGKEEANHDEEDPYGEEEWEEQGEDNTVSFSLQDFGRMTDNQIIKLVKDQLLNKTIIMTPEGIGNEMRRGYKFKDRFLVSDVIMKEPGDRKKEIVLLDPKGRWHVYKPPFSELDHIKQAPIRVID
jgi:hypothetical protein